MLTSNRPYSTSGLRQVKVIPLFITVTPGFKTACPGMMDLLVSDLALSVFVPTEWTGIKLEPYTLEVKPNIPAFLKARARPFEKPYTETQKQSLTECALISMLPLHQLSLVHLLLPPKPLLPSSAFCGDYRQINPFICIPQEPIPHVQQALAKAAGKKFFVDLDMTNSFL